MSSIFRLLPSSLAFGLALAAWLSSTSPAEAHQGQPESDPGSEAEHTGALPEQALRLNAQIDDAYNDCRIGSLFAKDAELYFADRGATRRASTYVKTVRKAFCGKFRRDSSPADLRMFSLPSDEHGFPGAILVGSQSMCAADDIHACVGQRMRFMAIWRRIDGRWKITRLVHYGHSPSTSEPANRVSDR
jgi:hypothetical protein